jgi:hypothetical protein
MRAMMPNLSFVVIASVSEAIQLRPQKDSGLLRRFTPRNDGSVTS